MAQFKLEVKDLMRVSKLYIATMLKGEFDATDPKPSENDAGEFDGIMVTIVPKAEESSQETKD